MSKTQRRSATTIANKRKRADARARKLANHAERRAARAKLRQERNEAKGIPRKKRAMLSKKQLADLKVDEQVTVAINEPLTTPVVV